MHTVELLDQSLELLKRLGYAVRQEWLAGSGGGECEFRGQKIFFLDLDLGPRDRLEQVLATLYHEPEVHTLSMPQELRELLRLRKSA